MSECLHIIKLCDSSHAPSLPNVRKGPWRVEDNANAGFSQFVSEKMGLSGTSDGQFYGNTLLPFDFLLEQNQRSDDICAMGLHDKRYPALK
jgi:hypothetical protein